MKPYAVSVVPLEDLVLFHKIEKIVQELPDINLGIGEAGGKILVSCHMLARALSSFYPVKCSDGCFGGTHKHSWLVTRNGLIIDVYPIAVVGGPILIDTRFMTPWTSLYKKLSLLELKSAYFRKNVGKVIKAVRQTMTTLGI